MAEPPYPDALPALTHLHWYVLERVLGQGGFGITYLAKDTNLDQRVAIKEYLPAEFASRLPDTTVRARTDELRDRYRWGLERFIQEARTLARFDHPNIVRVHSVFELHGTAYMVMGFEEGGTLAALLDRRGTLPEAELLRILLPVLDGLELVHNAGFIHRDIKPDNIHLRGDGRPVLLDFGSARQAVGANNTLTILVAPGYAPFEQYYSDPASQGPWTDIYGLAATAYRAICGRAPLDAVSRSKGILGSTQEIMVPASVVGAGRYSGRVLAAIDHGLAFAEKDRPQTIAEWRRELVGEATAASAMPPPNRPAPPVHPATAEPTVRSAPPPQPARDSASTRRAPPPPPAAIEAPRHTRSTAPWGWMVVVAAIAIATAAVYMAWVGQNDVAELKEQIRKKEQALPPNEPPRKDASESRRADAPPSSESAAIAQQMPPGAAEAPPTKPAQPQTPTAVPAREARPPAPIALVQSRKEARPPAVAAPAKREPSPPKQETPPPPAQPQPVSATPPSEPKAPAPPTTAQQLAEVDAALGDQRYADATKLLKPLAEAGDAHAQARLAGLYADGRGVERDPAAARTWYEKAANGGDTGAMLKLGAMYAGGSGVRQNYNIAYIWYGTAAELGSAAARVERDKVASQLQPAERQQGDRVIRSKVEQTRKAKEQ